MSERAERASVAAPHAEPTVAPTVARVGYAPITRVDAARREIELCATSEALDAHGTIFDYAASKAAFTRWLGNVREMHERRAVGRRVAVRCDDDTRRVYVRLRISRGAQDTWEKVLDGTLRGASIGASDVVWRRERRTLAGRSRWVNVATRYDLAELSLVDNPSNPDALGVTFVRDAAPDLTLLDPLEPAEREEPDELEELEDLEEPGQLQEHEEPANPLEPGAAPGADGAASQPTPDAVAERERRLPLHEATRTLLAGCACPRCEVALAALEEAAPSHMSDERATPHAGALTRALAAGLRVNAARLAQFDLTLSAALAALQPGDAQRLAAGEQAREAAQAEQTTQVVEELRARVARLEAQPAAGGPVARPVEKTLGGVGAASGGAHEPGYEPGYAPGAEFRALEALAGRLRDPQAQLAVAAEMIRLQQRGE
ncbi:MAG TPA: hypothetical protein VID73_13875 [Ktedonobacterales bacterium]